MSTLYTIETHSGIELYFDYHPRIIKEVKAIVDGGRPAARWIQAKRCWWLPISVKHQAEPILRKYGSKKGEAVAEQVVAIPPMPELEYDTTHFLRQPFHYQAQGIAQGLKFKRFINGDQPGLGKTLQSIVTVLLAEKHISKALPCLIICPNTLKENWKKEIELVAGMGSKTLILKPSIRKTWQTYITTAGVQFVIVNYESLETYFVAKMPTKKGYKLSDIVFKADIGLFKSVIIDESHKVKELATKQSKLTRGLCSGKEWVLSLTGTPVVNKTADLIGNLGIVSQLMNFGGYKYFSERYCGGVGGKDNLHLNELNSKLLTTCFFQRKKSEVLTDLPGKIRQIVSCDITTRREYDAALADLGSYLQQYRQKTDEQVEKSLRGQIMVQMGVCKNISARGKMPEVIEQIEEIVGGGQKVAVFLHQKEIAVQLLTRYPYALTITGKDDLEARNRAVELFQNDPSQQLILLSLKAASVGLTLTAAYNAIFIELPWHEADLNQAESRFDRIGQKNIVLSKIMLGKDTIDEYIWQIIERKGDVAAKVTGTEDNIQKELIDMLSSSLFNSKK